MSSKTKIITIVIVILLLICLCSAFLMGLVYFLSSSLYKQGNEIKDSVLLDVCSTHGDFNEIEYRAWFSEDFRKSTDLNETRLVVTAAFPEQYNCSNLQAKNVFDMLLKNQSLDVSIINGVNRATLTFPKDSNEFNTVEFVKSSGEWEIDSISVTLSSG